LHIMVWLIKMLAMRFYCLGNYVTVI
jgi:hypothetical protein